MATEQMAQMFGQLQQLSQQLVNQKHMFHRVWRYEPRDCQTKAFSKIKGFKGDEKAWPDWRYKFRVEASRCFRQAGAVLDSAEDRHDEPI